MTGVLEAVSGEVAKVAATAVLGGLDKGARKLFDVLRTKFPAVPQDPAELRQGVLTFALADPGWAKDLATALAAVGSGEVVSGAPRGISDFRDRVDQVTNPPAGGVKLIVAPSGYGGTELARQLADRVQEQYPSGRVELDLREYRVGDETDIAGLKQEVLKRCGIPEGEIAVDDARLDDQFSSVLLTRLCVVVLDNVTSARELEVFARFQANLTLATTAVATRDLRVLDPRPILLQGLDPEGAIEMLADFAGDVRLADELPEVHELLALCDRMPLAIREAGLTLALRTGEARPVAGLLAEYQAAGVVGAEAVVADAVRRTFDALAPEAVTACALLADFPGGRFTRDTALVYLGEDRTRADAALSALIEAQLVERRVRAGYSLTRLARDHARTLPADRDAAFERLLRYVRDNVVAADLEGDRETGLQRLREYDVPGELRWTLGGDRFDWLDRHFGLIAALVEASCLRRRHVDVCQLAGAVEVLVNQRWRWREYAEICDWALQAAKALDEQARQDGHDKAALLARTYQMRARARFLIRWFELAEADLSEAHRLAGEATTPEWPRKRLQASVAEFWGRLREEQADVLAASGGDPRVMLSGAVDWFRSAVSIDDELGDRAALAIHLRMLAATLVKVGYLAEALACATRALEFAVGRNRGRVYTVFAKAYLALGDTIHARESLQNARSEMASARAQQYEWELREIEARLLVAEGNVEAARTAWGTLADDAFKIGHPRANDYVKAFGLLPPPSGRRWRFPW
ncbi:hypothetical protein FPZ12_009350 [Amycolatopsis acidicola]|uniref:NB-ARC domain-containing protein n=1 Tax=Amycolatopsis acidicola TaxID=2596893 RepID=A0A5N0VET4_9PSEU|nr:hypothetical protein [Amycolatopsis acidicola]KAA9163202.1 hypothetical protein FPZ12_009350 [Amycolatopsis acidicola]